MAVIGQSHLLWRNRVPDHISHSSTIVRIVPIEVGRCLAQGHDPETPSENQTQHLSIRCLVLYHKVIVIYKVLINSRETGMFVKVFFFGDIRLSSESDLYTL